MFGFFKKKESSSTEILDAEPHNQSENGSLETSAGYVAAYSAQQAVQQAAKTFAKPDSYTGNRNLYDSQAAKASAKKALFKDGNVVRDPYTGERLVLTRAEARQLYGDNWTKHLAESDHIKPLEKIYQDTRNNVWNTTEDIRAAANSGDNMRVSSRQFNNAKRSRTNKEFVEDEVYLKSKGVNLTDEGRRNAILDGETAEASINKQLRQSTIKNVVRTGHEAGIEGAQQAGGTALTMSAIMNISSVIRGEKSSEEAIEDTLMDGGKAAVTGYAMGGGLTVVSHSLSESSSEFIRGLVESNVPGKVITAVMVTGDTLKRYADGEITTQECLIELGDKGLNLATMGYSMAVGQTLIPIPIVGGAVGALVGSTLTSTYYQNLIHTLQTKELEHQERMRIIEECHQAVQQTKAFRQELENYLQTYFKDYQDCFEGALSAMRFSYQAGDADGIIASANDITRKLGGTVQYETVQEFKTFLDSDDAFIL